MRHHAGQQERHSSFYEGPPPRDNDGTNRPKLDNGESHERPCAARAVRMRVIVRRGPTPTRILP